MAYEGRMKWFAPNTGAVRLEGLAFYDKERLYRRLPVDPEVPLPAGVETLSWHTAGVQARVHAVFQKLELKVRITEAHSFDHMAPIGQCGFDCYADDGSGLKFYASGRFDPKAKEYSAVLLDMPRRRELDIVIDFPLYTGVSDILIGFDRDAELSLPKPHAYGKRIVAYGTSITQGGCASRPGMAYTNILSRRLDAEFINLGFSGNGRAEAEVAAEVAKVENVGMFIVDAEANCPSAEWIGDHYPPFIRILREAHPDAHILLLTAAPRSVELYDDAAAAMRIACRETQKRIAEDLRTAGDEKVHFLPFDEIIAPSRPEETVDGTHATDLGFLNLANGLEPVLRRILNI